MFEFVDNFIKILKYYKKKLIKMYNNEHESVTINFFEHLPYKRM